MSKKVGSAVVDLGVGENHVAAANSENADLIAICELRQDRLYNITKDHPDVKTHKNFDEMLKNSDFDIVSIRVPRVFTRNWR